MRQAAEQYGGIVMPTTYWHCHEAGTSANWGHRSIGNTRTWLTSVPPWMFFKNMSYHIRAVDVLGFHGAVIFSGHAGPHSPDIPVFSGDHAAARCDPVALPYADGHGHGRVAFRGR